jgi:hypothetical protein
MHQWSNEEVEKAWSEWRNRPSGEEGDAMNAAMRRVMSEAVTLFLARASGQAKQDVKTLRNVFWDDSERGPFHQAINRLSALAQEAEALRAMLSERETLLAGFRERETICAQALESLRAKAEEMERSELATQMDALAWKSDLDVARAEVERLKAELGAIHTAVFTGMDESMTTEEGRRVVAEVDLLKRRSAELGDLARKYREGRTNARTRADTAESRLAAIRERATNEEGRAKACEGLSHPINIAMAVAQWVLEGDVPQEAQAHVPACPLSPNAHVPAPDGTLCECDRIRRDVARLAAPVGRYPCSDTCMHDDAANPGHPERVRLFGGAVAKVAGLEGTVTDELRPITLKSGARVTQEDEPDMDAVRRMFEAERAKVAERVKERSEAVNQVVADPSFSATEASAYEQGAEAMRAACWEAVQACLAEEGFTDGGYLRERLKAKIEGATP